jgi:hypothetical protein
LTPANRVSFFQPLLAATRPVALAFYDAELCAGRTLQMGRAAVVLCPDGLPDRAAGPGVTAAVSVPQATPTGLVAVPAAKPRTLVAVQAQGSPAPWLVVVARHERSVRGQPVRVLNESHGEVVDGWVRRFATDRLARCQTDSGQLLVRAPLDLPALLVPGRYVVRAALVAEAPADRGPADWWPLAEPCGELVTFSR